MPTPDKLARRARKATLESLRANDDAEDLEALLVASNELHGVFFCAPCRVAGFTTRVDRRGATCINHYRQSKARAA